MSRDDIVVGLDIGTTKVCAVVGHGDARGVINIAGVGIVPSRGIKKGVVIDVEDTVTAIRESVDRARHMAGVELHSAVAGVTGSHIQSSNRRGTVTVAGEGGVISSDDVERVLQAAAMDVPHDREIIHSLPRYFAVDGHRGVRRPIGMCGQRLEVETHVVTGTASFLQNIVQCVERAGLHAEAIVLEPIATSEAVATPDERELGVALIDIGGGTSDIAVFVDGSIIHSDVISVGGNHVTRDISIGLRTPFEQAERLKIERGVASPSLIPHGEALEVLTAGSGERLRLPRAILGEIIEARMSELLEMARDAIGRAGVQSRLPAGIILTGGGAMLPGAIELAAQIFDMPVRLGKPIELAGWGEQVETPQFSTGVGLVRFGLRQRAGANGFVTAPTSPAPLPPEAPLSATAPTVSTRAPQSPPQQQPAPPQAQPTPQPTPQPATTVNAPKPSATDAPPAPAHASTSTSPSISAATETVAARVPPRRRVWDDPVFPVDNSQVPTVEDLGGQSPTDAATANNVKVNAEPSPPVGSRTIAARQNEPEAAIADDIAEPSATPFDRFRPKALKRRSDAADGDTESRDQGGAFSLWHKLVTKLRQLIGFEMS